MMAKPRGVLIAGNWKMNHGPLATAKFFAELRAQWNEKLSSKARAALGAQSPQSAGTSTPLAMGAGALRACVLPPAVSLSAALAQARELPLPGAVAVGAQNAHWEKSGAFTGELSGPMLGELGVRIALVAHSERRQFFGETDDTARKRAESLLDQGFQVIFCIGETRAEREAGQTESVLLRQLRAVLPEMNRGASRFLDGTMIFAYEPVWAIGTGLTATPQQAEEAHQIIRKFLWDRFGMEAAGRTPILYGGSVTPENAAALLACANVDGGLAGGASLKPESFIALLNAGAGAL